MATARAVKKYEQKVSKDWLFNRVTTVVGNVPVWRVEVILADNMRFTSNKKYASESSARAAAKRIEERYL